MSAPRGKRAGAQDDVPDGADAGLAQALETRVAPRTSCGGRPTAIAPRLTFATSLGIEDCVVIDMIARARLPIDLFTLDTGLLFPETYALWEQHRSSATA